MFDFLFGDMGTYFDQHGCFESNKIIFLFKQPSQIKRRYESQI